MAVTDPMTLDHRAAANAVAHKLEELDAGTGELTGDGLAYIEDQDGCFLLRADCVDGDALTGIICGLGVSSVVRYFEESTVLLDDATEERAVFALEDLPGAQAAIVAATLIQPDTDSKRSAALEVTVEACEPERLDEKLHKVARNVEDHRAGRHAAALARALSESNFIDGKSVLGDQLDRAVDEVTQAMGEALTERGPRRSWAVFGVYPDFPDGGTWLQFAYADSAQEAARDARQRMKKLLVERNGYDKEYADGLIDESEVTHICEGKSLAEDMVGFAVKARNQ